MILSTELEFQVSDQVKMREYLFKFSVCFLCTECRRFDGAASLKRWEIRKVPVEEGLLMLFLHEQVVWTCRVEELELKIK